MGLRLALGTMDICGINILMCVRERETETQRERDRDRERKKRETERKRERKTETDRTDRHIEMRFTPRTVFVRL